MVINRSQGKIMVDRVIILRYDCCKVKEEVCRSLHRKLLTRP